jgi:SAM-dependent methyltransferase
MIDVVRAKAQALGAAGIRPVTAAVEALDAEAGYFDLAVIGNAFHRLDRDRAAARLYGWLRPGGCAALCWSSGPEAGEQPWQRAMAEVTGRWRAALGAWDRVPADWNERRVRRPDRQVLSDAGFAVSGRREFSAVHRWSIAGLAGYTRSTSVLPPSVLAGQGAAFDADLAAALGPLGEDGTFTQAVSFAYELARKPA